MRIVSHSIKKALFMLGGRAVLLPVILLALCAAFAAFGSAMSASISPTCRVAAVDNCGGELSQRLIRELASSDGFTVTICESEDKAKALILDSEAEAMLIISADYDRELSGGGSDLIGIFTVPGSVSAELIRETLAGKLIAQRSYVNASGRLDADGFDASRLDGMIASFDAPTLYRIESVSGKGSDGSVFGLGFPGYEGFAALAVMLVMLTLAHRLTSHEARLVAVRLRVLEGGSLIDSASDALSIFGTGLLLSAAAFAFSPNRSFVFAAALIGYDAFLTGLLMLLVRTVRTGRMDIASPFIALITSILGGCFADLASLSPALTVLARLTPQGQLIAGCHGAPMFIAALMAEGIVLALLSIRAGKRC